jgi:hypothetical protein
LLMKTALSGRDSPESKQQSRADSLLENRFRYRSARDAIRIGAE